MPATRQRESCSAIEWYGRRGEADEAAGVRNSKSKDLRRALLTRLLPGKQMPEERVIRRQSLSSIAVGSFYELIVSCVQMGAKRKAATTGPIAVTCKTVQPKRQHPVTANDITGQKKRKTTSFPYM